MLISTRIIRYVSLGFVAVAVAAPVAQPASRAESREAAFRAAHWKHEDSIYGAVRVASVQPLPASLEAHWNHEDAQYNSRTVSLPQPQSTPLSVESGEGVGLFRALIAAGGMIALLLLGTAAVTSIRRKHRHIAPS